MKQLFLYTVLFFSFGAYAQQLKGVIIDENEEKVALAMVQLLHNNQIVQYTMTNEQGGFFFENVTPGSYTLVANHFSYDKLTEAIVVEKDLQTTLVMMSKAEELPAIEIEARAALATRKGDTLTYNLNAVTNGTEQKLKDVLNKLPGVEVDAATGKISANGKVVDDLMINGQSLFGKNHKLATENINAEMLEGVSLISNFEKFTALKEVEGSEKTAMNIAIKKEFLGKLTGDAELFGAAKNRYKLHAKLFQFNQNNSLSIIANTNNTGEESLSFFDFLELNSSIKSDIRNQNLSKEDASADFPDFLLANKNITQRNNQFASLYSVYKPLNHWTINSYAIGNYTSWLTEELSVKNFYNTNLRLEDSQKNKLKSLNVLGKINSDYYIGQSSLVNYVLSMGVNRLNKRSDIAHLMASDTTIYNERQLPHQFNLGQQLSFIQKLNPKSLLSFNAFYELKKNDHQYHLNSNEKVFLTNDFAFYQNRTLHSQEYGVFAKYTLRLGKEMLYANTGFNGLYQQANYELVREKKTDYLDRNYWFGNVSMARKNTDFEYGILTEFRHYPKENISVWLPQALAKYHFKKDTNVIEAQYSRSVSLPTVADLNSSHYANDFRNTVLQSMLNPNEEFLKNTYELRYRYMHFYHGIMFFAMSKYEQNQSLMTTRNHFAPPLNYSAKVRATGGSQWINSIMAEKNVFKIRHKIGVSAHYFDLNQPMYAQGLADINTFREGRLNLSISSNFKQQPFNYQLGFEVKNTQTFTQNNPLKIKQTSYQPQLHINWTIAPSITAYLQHHYHWVTAQGQETRFWELNYQLKYKPTNAKWHAYLYAENFTNLNGNELLSTIQQPSYIEVIRTQRLAGFIGAGVVFGI